MSFSKDDHASCLIHVHHVLTTLAKTVTELHARVVWCGVEFAFKLQMFWDVRVTIRYVFEKARLFPDILRS